MGISRVKSVIKRIPGARRGQRVWQALRNCPAAPALVDAAPPGHFYSPVPDLEYVKQHREEIFARDRAFCHGIDPKSEEQVALVNALAAYYGEMPFPEEKQDGLRYYLRNPYFGRGSSAILYLLMRHFQPAKITEVGSGFSSAAMLDVNDRFFDGSIQFSFVEPYPERLYSLLQDTDAHKYQVYVESAQHVPQEAYTRLRENDILFIDSSHVAKVGSDVVYLLTEILPVLQKGVIIHFHDIYWPFEYPEDWVFMGRAWNEAYMVKAFLQFNKAFEVLIFNSYLATHHNETLGRCLPGVLDEPGSGLWIRKVQ